MICCSSMSLSATQPHGDQITGAFVFPLQRLTRRDNPQAISRHQISEDAMVEVPAKRFAVGSGMSIVFVVRYDVHNIGLRYRPTARERSHTNAAVGYNREMPHPI